MWPLPTGSFSALKNFTTLRRHLWLYESISTPFLLKSEREVTHTNLWFSRYATDPLNSWSPFPSSGQGADFNNSFRSFKCKFLWDSWGNTECPRDLLPFTVLTCSVISTGTENNLQARVRYLCTREEMWFEFPQTIEGMGCASPSSMRPLIPID